MKEEQIVLFEGNEVKVKTDKGETLINLVHTAKNCGLTRNGNTGKPKIRWDSVKKKLKSIYGGVENSTPQHNVPFTVAKEINYILDEIENTDDRNSIYMSSWLSRRFAMECHSEVSKKYKNFLATLDEKREKGELQTNQLDSSQLTQMVTDTIKGVLPTLVTEVSKTFGEVVNKSKENVDNMTKLMHDQATIYDQDRESLKGLIGFKSANTKAMSLKLKEKLEEKFNRPIKATNELYLKYKRKVFTEFHVSKWEDIPVTKQSYVYSFIEECLFEN